MKWQLDKRCKAILDILLFSDKYITIQELSKKLNISKRSIYYDLNKINDWLKMYNINSILVERNKGMYISSLSKFKINQLLEGEKKTYYVLSQEERISIIICCLIGTNDSIFIEKITSICDVSRNTIFSDLKKVKKIFDNYELELVFEVHFGYRVVGSSIKKLSLFLYYLGKIIKLLENNLIIDDLPFFDEEKINTNINKLMEIEFKLNKIYVANSIFKISILINLLELQKEKLDYEDIDTNEVQNTKEFLLVKYYFPNLKQDKLVYITLHLLGTRVQVPINKYSSQKIKEIATKLVVDFQRLSCIIFEDDDKRELIDLLTAHLNISFYRYKYGIYIDNPVFEKIIQEYNDLFNITKKVCKNLSLYLSLPINDEEISFITMHFGGYLKKKKIKTDKYNILIVCPNGISTANIIKNEVENLHPNIKVLEIIPVKNVKNYYENIDLIISTTDIKTDMSYLKVNPIIEKEDKQKILNMVFNKSYKKTYDINLEKIYILVKQYVDPQYHNSLRIDLKNFFEKNYIYNNQQIDRLEGLSITDILTEKNICFRKQIENWQKAVICASKILLKENLINYNYINAMIKNIAQYGPYIVITPRVAFAHAKPEDGVYNLGVSILCIEKPINMLGNQVNIIFVLAPIDKTSHLKLLKEVMEFFIEESNIDILIKMNNPTKAFDFLIDKIRS